MASQSLPNPAGSEPSGTYGGSGIGVSGASEPQKRAYDAGNAFVAMTRQTNLAAMLNKADRTVYLIGEAVKGLPNGTTKDREIKTQIYEGLANSKQTLGLIKNNSLYKGTTSDMPEDIGPIIMGAIRDMAGYNFETKKWSTSPTDKSQLAKFVRTVILRDVLRPNANAGNNTPRSKSPGNTEISALFAKGGVNQEFFLNCQNVGLGRDSNLRIPRYNELNKCIIETYNIMSPRVAHAPPLGEPKDRYSIMMTDFMNFKQPGQPEKPQHLNNILKRMHAEFPGVIPEPPPLGSGRDEGAGGAAAGGVPVFNATIAVRPPVEPQVGDLYAVSRANVGINHQLNIKMLIITEINLDRVYYNIKIYNDNSLPNTSYKNINEFKSMTRGTPDTDGYYLTKLSDLEASSYIGKHPEINTRLAPTSSSSSSAYSATLAPLSSSNSSASSNPPISSSSSSLTAARQASASPRSVDIAKPVTADSIVVGHYYLGKKQERTGTRTMAAYKITAKTDSTVSYEKTEMVNGTSKTNTLENISIETFLTELNNYAIISMHAVKPTLGGFSTMRGGRRTLKRKMTNRRKTGKKVKPSPSQLS